MNHLDIQNCTISSYIVFAKKCKNYKNDNMIELNSVTLRTHVDFSYLNKLLLSSEKCYDLCESQQ